MFLIIISNCNANSSVEVDSKFMEESVLKGNLLKYNGIENPPKTQPVTLTSTISEDG